MNKVFNHWTFDWIYHLFTLQEHRSLVIAKSLEINEVEEGMAGSIKAVEVCLYFF